MTIDTNVMGSKSSPDKWTRLHTLYHHIVHRKNKAEFSIAGSTKMITVSNLQWLQLTTLSTKYSVLKWLFSRTDRD